jgi:hypothetical protein
MKVSVNSDVFSTKTAYRKAGNFLNSAIGNCATG